MRVGIYTAMGFNLAYGFNHGYLKKHRLGYFTYKKQLGIVLVIWMLGFVFSMETVLSLSMMAVFALAIFQLKAGRFGFRPHLKTDLRQFLTTADSWALMMPFLLVLCTMPYSTEDPSYLLERLRIKLPYLILPFAFFRMPTFSKRAYRGLHYIFLLLMTLVAVGVSIHYALHFEAINDMIYKGQPMPTPTNHIRFSLMVALAILVAADLWQQGYYWAYHWEKHLIAVLGLFLLVFIHLLSVRSGLAVLYASAFILLIRYIWQSRKIVLGGLLLLSLFALPLLAYYSLPSFQTKISYMRWDLKMHLEGKGSGYSDSERIQSLTAAKEIIASHPICGVGAGDVKYAMKQQYAHLYPDITDDSFKMPHNQYVSVWAGAGIVGVLFFLWGMLRPLYHQKRYSSHLFLSIHCIILLSFLVENTIETAVGISFHLLFVLLGMATFRGKKE